MGNFTVSLKKLTEKVSMDVVYTPQDLENISVEIAEVNRPGLFLAGYDNSRRLLPEQLIQTLPTLFLREARQEVHLRQAHDLQTQLIKIIVIARQKQTRAVHFGDLHTDLIQFLRRIDNFHADTVGQRFERDIECAHSCSSCAPFCCTALPAVRYRAGFLLIIIIERSVKNNIVRAAFSQPGKNARSSAAMY